MFTHEYWQMLDDHPPHVTNLADLIGWSHNCDFPTPLHVFMDLTGYSEENWGENYCTKMPRLGYLELSKLGKAIDEYTVRPHDVHDWLKKLLEEEI